VRPLAGRFGECHLDRPLDHRRWQRQLAGRAGGLMQQAVDALGHEPRLPTPDRRFAFVGLPLDRHRAHPGGRAALTVINVRSGSDQMLGEDREACP